MSPLLAALTWLLVLQCAGEALTRVAGLPVPGPVVGFALLFVTLLLRPTTIENVAPAADGLARHLSLLFVPAGVGVMLHVATLAREGWAIAIALVVSTVVAIAVAAIVFALLARRATEDGRER